MCSVSWKKKRKLKLYDKHEGKCWWCSCSTVLPPSYALAADLRDNTATIEHLRSKFHPLRYEPARGGNDVRTVLACRWCNQLRSRLEMFAVTSAYKGNLIVYRQCA